MTTTTPDISHCPQRRRAIRTSPVLGIVVVFAFAFLFSAACAAESFTIKPATGALTFQVRSAGQTSEFQIMADTKSHKSNGSKSREAELLGPPPTKKTPLAETVAYMRRRGELENKGLIERDPNCNLDLASTQIVTAGEFENMTATTDINMPRINDGDVVSIRTAPTPNLTFKRGGFYLVKLTDGRQFLRRLFTRRIPRGLWAGEYVMLLPGNPKRREEGTLRVQRSHIASIQECVGRFIPVHEA